MEGDLLEASRGRPFSRVALLGKPTVSPGASLGVRCSEHTAMF